MKANHKTLLIRLLKFIFAVVVLYWLWHSDRIDFKVILKIFDPIYGPLIVALFVLSILTMFYRLHFLMGRNDLVISFREVVKASLMGLFFNFTLPGGAGGDLVKSYYLWQPFPTRKSILVSVVIADRLIGVVGLLLMAFIALLSQPRVLLAQKDLQIMFLLLTAILAGFIFILFYFYLLRKNPDMNWPGFRTLMKFSWFRKVHDLAAYVLKIKNFLMALGITLISQFIAVLVMYYIGVTSFGQSHEYIVELLPFFIVVPLGFLTTAIPISPGGIGVGQVAFYALFKIYTDTSSDLGPTIITTYQVLLFSAGLVGLFYYLRSGKKPKSDLSEMTQNVDVS